MTDIVTGSTNVYADLGGPDADKMLVKAQLVTQIRNVISVNLLTETDACRALGLSQFELSGLLDGKFRSVSETKLRDYINCLNTGYADL